MCSQISSTKLQCIDKESCMGCSVGLQVYGLLYGLLEHTSVSLKWIELCNINISVGCLAFLLHIKRRGKCSFLIIVCLVKINWWYVLEILNVLVIASLFRVEIPTLLQILLKGLLFLLSIAPTTFWDTVQFAYVLLFAVCTSPPT